MASLAPCVSFNERAASRLRVFDVTAHYLRRGSSGQLALEYPALEHQPAPIVNRCPVINHHYGSPAAPQNSVRFANGPLRIRRMVKHAERVDHVEALVGKRQAF